MPILKNAKHEAFAHGIAKGSSIAQAYIDAGYSEQGANPSGIRLLRNATVQARIDEIKSNIEKAVEEKVGITKAYVISKLQQNLERALQEVAVVDRDGKETGEYRYEGSVANRAAELIGKELGMFSDKLKISGDAGEAPIKLVVEYVGRN
jgi:phage terminase small subunit